MKKFWYLLPILLFLFILIFINWECVRDWFKPKAPDSKETPAYRENVPDNFVIEGDGKDAPTYTINRKRRDRQMVVTYKNPQDADRMAFHRILLDKHYKLLKTCDCSDKVELWEYPVGASPDGQDVNRPPGGSGGVFTIANFVVQDVDTNVPLVPKTEIVLPPSGEGLRETRIPVVSPYPQAEFPTAKIKVVISDSGVDSTDEFLYPRTRPPFASYLFNNIGAMYCNTSITEGHFGMNILRNTEGEASSEPQDLDGHGTFIGGVIAGLARPKGDHLGDAEKVNIDQIHARFIRKRDLTSDLFSALCSIHYAISKNAKIINASWRVISNKTDEAVVKEAFCPTMLDVKEKDVLIVAAAGNEHFDLDKEVKTWPACFAKHTPTEPEEVNFSGNVLTVGSWDVDKDSLKVSFFSNHSKPDTYVDMYAPGAKVLSTGLGSIYYWEGNGTSYAAPFVTRTAAILRGLYPLIPARDIKGYIKDNADKKLPTNILLHNHKNAMGGKSALAPRPPGS